MQQIPVNILTGYLGSGKTTLLNFILTQYHGHKIAVIENEFGEIGVDQDIVIQADEEIFEMNNGCVCCSVRGDLVRILQGLLLRKNRFDRVIVETTGVADPAPVIQTFLAEPSLKASFRLDGVITLVDAAHISEQLGRSPEVKRQISFSDRVVLTKTDLLSDAQLAHVESLVQQLNPRVEMLRAQRGNVDLSKILEIHMHQESGIAKSLSFVGQSRPRFSLKAHKDEEVAEHEEGVSAVCVEVQTGLAHRMMLEFWINLFTSERGKDIYRLKGIVALQDERERFIIQGVHSMVDFSFGKPWEESEARKSVLVVIGKNLDQKLIEETFRQCFR
jgi:G3E family GTPase